MDQQLQAKQAVAAAALEYVLPRLRADSILGIGTGSTANCFIDLLGAQRRRFAAAVASSRESAERLRAAGVVVRDLCEVERIAVYVDGADEVNPRGEMIKGGGAALTGEKIVAAAREEFVCIVDASKRVDVLGGFPLPVEVIPMAVRQVAAELARFGGEPRVRAGVVTEYGNRIIDLAGLRIAKPAALEREINQIAGVVSNGLFAVRPADRVFCV